MSASHRPRVLFVIPDRSDRDDSKAADLERETDHEVVVRPPATAAEFLRELGPTIDCVVCAVTDPDCVEALSADAGEVPLVVYGDEVPPVPVGDVVATDGGTGELAARVTARVEQARKRDELTEANAKLSALNTYTRELTGCATVEEVSDTVVDAVTNALGHGRVVLAMVDDDDEFYPYGHTFPGEIDVTMTVDEGVAGRTYRTGETQIVDDYRSDPDCAREIDVRSAVSVPVGDHGIVQVTSGRVGVFDERDAEFLEIVASHAGEALSRLRREAELRLERDSLHAFFDGISSPAVYVEADAPEEDPTLREVNSAYERAFGDAPVGSPVSRAFPTDTERRLFGDDLHSAETVTREVERETDDGVEPFTVGLVPVRAAAPESAAFGVYTREEPE